MNQQNNKFAKGLLYLFGGVYGLMMLGSLGMNIWVMQKSANVDPTVTEINESEVKDYVERQVDRSYNRFFNQFSFALGLVGVSVWILRQSIIDQLREQLEKPVQKAAETAAKEEAESVAQKKVVEYLREEGVEAKIAELFSKDRKLKAQLQKTEIIVQLSMSLPTEEVFFQLQVPDEVQEPLKKIVSKLNELKKNSELGARALSESIDTYLALTFTDYIALGDAYFCFKEWKKAEVAYRKVTDEKETEKHPKALFGLGNALRKQGLEKQRQGQEEEAKNLLDEASKSYKKATETKSYYFAAAHVNKGFALRRLRNNDEGLKEGIECFDAALEIEPNDYRALYNKACYYALLSQPNTKAALRCLKRAIALTPARCKGLAEVDPDFCKIRDDEGFKHLIPGYKANCSVGK
jgi:tetratricopeptide (TPR) repeat protein